MLLAAIAKTLQVGALLAAWALARRLRSYRPIAIFLAAMTAADWCRWILLGVLAHAPRPRAGWHRVAYHAEQALFLAWPIAVAALAAGVFLRAPWRRMLGGAVVVWALLVTGLAASYPGLRGAPLAVAYAVINGAGVVAGFACVASWARKVRHPEAEHRATIWILSCTGASLLGAYGDTFARWPIAQVVFAALYAVLLVISGRTLWTQSPRSQPPARSSPRPLLH